MKVWFIFAAALLLFAGLAPREGLTRREKLSEYGFFKGQLAALDPVDNVIPYEVNTPLFTNYAEKKRFVHLPEGLTGNYSDSSAFSLPVGTVLIKNFYYPEDARRPEGRRNIIETRLLVHQPSGWEAWPYIWNAEQTDAVYDPAGETLAVTFLGKNGKKKSVTHAVPNKNQCKGCHARKDAMQPIGITARQLNRQTQIGGQSVSQLEYWKSRNVLSSIPEATTIPRLAVWDDPATGSLSERARAYLDANCAHCHSKDGPASTSGLFLDVFEKNRTRIGVMKTPVAAGRGASDLSFDIVPGKPDQSILLFRMKSVDPGIAMPELGREEIHSEGVALIEEWIRKQAL